MYEISVLILIDEDEAELLAIFFKNFGIVFKKLVSFYEQVVKVHSVALAAALGVFCVYG